MNLIWFPVAGSPELFYTYIGKFRVEKAITKHGTRFSIGYMKDALILFESERMIYKFLTV